MKQDQQLSQPAGQRQRDYEELIQRRAYELYLERGQQPGDEIADWLRAERELSPAMPALPVVEGFLDEDDARRKAVHAS